MHSLSSSQYSVSSPFIHLKIDIASTLKETYSFNTRPSLCPPFEKVLVSGPSPWLQHTILESNIPNLLHGLKIMASASTELLLPSSLIVVWEL
jgi:hypothetical protein